MKSLLRLKELIQSKGTTGKELSEAVGVSQTSITNIIQGRTFPKPDLLVLLAETLGVDIRDLFHPTKEENKSNRLLIEHKGKYYPIGAVNRALFDSIGNVEPISITTEN